MIKYLDELRKDDVVYIAITSYLDSHPDFRFSSETWNNVRADYYLPNTHNQKERQEYLSKIFFHMILDEFFSGNNRDLLVVLLESIVSILIRGNSEFSREEIVNGIYEIFYEEDFKPLRIIYQEDWSVGKLVNYIKLVIKTRFSNVTEKNRNEVSLHHPLSDGETELWETFGEDDKGFNIPEGEEFFDVMDQFIDKYVTLGKEIMKRAVRLDWQREYLDEILIDANEQQQYNERYFYRVRRRLHDELCRHPEFFREKNERFYNRVKRSCLLFNFSIELLNFLRENGIQPASGKELNESHLQTIIEMMLKGAGTISQIARPRHPPEFLKRLRDTLKLKAEEFERLFREIVFAVCSEEFASFSGEKFKNLYLKIKNKCTQLVEYEN